MGKTAKIGLILFTSLGLVIIVGLLVFHYFSSRKAALVIETNVPSQVYINERQVGKTPYEGEFEQKEIDLKLVPESFEQALIPYETRIKLTAGVKTIVRREFGAEEGGSSGIEVSFDESVDSKASIAVVTEPTGAKVFVDDIFVDVSPTKSSDLAPGIHKVKVEAEGHEAKSITVQAQRGYLLTVFVDLKQVEPILEDEAFDPKNLVDQESQEQNLIEILDTPTGFLRVRSQPSTSSAELIQVKPGDKYSLLEISEDEDWYKIELDNGTEGWVSAQYAQILQPDSEVD